MNMDKQKQPVSPEQELGLTLDDLIKRGARQVIQQAIEAELAELLFKVPQCPGAGKTA